MNLNSLDTNSNNRVSLGHAARIIGVCERTCRRWAESGKLGQPRGTHPIMIEIAAIEAAIGPVTKERIERTRTERAPRKRQIYRVPRG